MRTGERDEEGEGTTPADLGSGPPRQPAGPDDRSGTEDRSGSGHRQRRSARDPSWRRSRSADRRPRTPRRWDDKAWGRGPWGPGPWDQGTWNQGRWAQGTSGDADDDDDRHGPEDESAEGEHSQDHRRRSRPPWGDQPGRRRDHRRPPVGIAAFVIAMIQVIGTRISMSGDPGEAVLGPLGYLLLLIGPAALFARRRLPLTTLAITVAATSTYLIMDYPRGPFFLAALVALFGAVRRADRAISAALCALAFAAYVVVGSASVGQYVLVGVLTFGGLFLAEANRVRAKIFAQMAAAQAEAAKARKEQSRRQASDERLRIARELHDVLGHHLSLINVRAGVGLHLLDSDPEQAREALGAIKLASAEALREVRGVLSTLNPQPGAAPRAPAPGLSDLDALAEETRAARIDVIVHRTGEPVTVPGEVGRAAYRIVQEALTNVRRHAGPAASVTVTIGYQPDALTIRVDDTGAGAAASTSDGNGIPGMRERAAALGGILTAASRPEGGFRVDARLPLTQETS